MQQTIVSVEELAARLGVSRWTIYRREREGVIVSLSVSRHKKFELEQTLEMLRKRRTLGL